MIQKEKPFLLFGLFVLGFGVFILEGEEAPQEKVESG